MSDLVEKFNKNCSEELKKMGILFCLLNRIENNLNHIIETFFCDFNQLKGVTLNQILLGKNIKLETKRTMFLKIIEHTTRYAEKGNFEFEKNKWLKFCKDLQKIQEVRNKLAHKFLGFSENVVFYQEILKNDNNKNYTFDKKEINLDKEIEKFDKIFDESELLFTDFLNQVLPIVRDCQKCNLSDI